MKSVLTIVAAFVLLLISLFFVKIRTVEGNEMGVVETWSGGVAAEPYHPKTYVFFPGFTTTLYTYDMTKQVFVMNDRDNGEEYGEGRKADAYLVQSKEGQDMRISLNVQWKRDPAKVVDLHKTVRDAVEERLIRPVVMRVVKDEATQMSALDAYSGTGLVDLQKTIAARLTDPASELRHAGVIVENFLIEHIALDAKYVDEIKARQVAVQAKLRADEETKAAYAVAERAKATAQADYEKQVVEAKRDKEVGILQAQKQAEQKVLDAQAAAKQVELAAEAEKNRNVLIALGEKEAALNRAQAIEAIGQAEAEALKLKLGAYSASGADGYVRIEVAKSMSEAFRNIAGYLPEGMSVNLLAEQYNKGVNLLVGAGAQ